MRAYASLGDKLRLDVLQCDHLNIIRIGCVAKALRTAESVRRGLGSSQFRWLSALGKLNHTT